MTDKAPSMSKRATIGKVGKCVVGTDWESYMEQLDFNFLANGVSNAKVKKAVLLVNIPNKTNPLAKDIMDPAQLKNSTITYDLIEKRMRKTPHT